MAAGYYAAAMNDEPWTELRSQMPAAARYAYLDHAAKGPLPKPAAAAIRDYADDVEQHGGRHWPRWFGQVAEVRGRVASLIGAGADEIALVNNTAAAIGTVAEGVDWRDGDNVVVPACEFPSNLFPWKNLESRGVECRAVPCDPDGVGAVDLAALKDACDGRTRLIACSWVGWETGYTVDLGDLCDIAAGCGARLLVDGIQAVGVRHLNLAETPIDYLAGECRKWLLGPEGLGYLYVRKSRQAELRPTRVGWASMAQENPFGDEFQLRDTAERFETAMMPFVLVAAVNASLKLLELTTPQQRQRRLQTISDEVVALLNANGATVASVRGPQASAIVAAAFKGQDNETVFRGLLNQGVVVSFRGGRVRVSPHVYSDADDLTRLANVLQQL